MSDTQAQPRIHWWVRGLKWLVRGTLAVLIVLMLVVPALIWGLLHSETVTQLLLPHLPGVRVVGGKGALLGDFSAQRVEIDLPRGSLLSLDDAAWTALTIYPDPAAAWRFGVHAQALSARLVQIKWVPNPTPEPTTDPYDLRLPLSVVVERVQAQRGESSLWGPHALTQLDGRLEMKQTHHRADIRAVAYGPWQLHGHGHVKTLGRLQGELQLQAQGVYAYDSAPSSPALPVKADIQATGPLTDLTVNTQVTVGAQKQAQSLQGTARLRLWAPWMLPALHVKAKQFDLAALLDTLPRSALTGSVDWDTQGQVLHARADLRNGLPGEWTAARLPVRQLSAKASLPDALHAASLQALVEAGQLQLQATTVGAQDGQLSVNGSWDLRLSRLPNRVKVGLQAVNLRAMHAQAPALVLSGQVETEPDRRPQGAKDWLQALWSVNADLSGRYTPPSVVPGRPAAEKAVAATLRGQWRQGQVQVDDLTLQAEGARATLKGKGQYSPPAQGSARWGWQTQSQLKVERFDPQVWLPWPAALTGSNRLDGVLNLDLASNWRGKADLRLDPSLLAGTPLEGSLSWQASGKQAVAALDLDALAAGNRVRAQGQLPWQIGADGLPRTRGEQHWHVNVQAPALKALQHLASVWGVKALSGLVEGEFNIDGQWPSLATQGQLLARQVQWQIDGQSLSELADGRASWDMQTLRWDAPLHLQAQLGGLKLPHLQLDQATWDLQGTGRDHRSTLSLQGKPVSSAGSGAGTTAGAGKKLLEPMVVVMSLQGGLQGAGNAVGGWRGRVQSLNWQSAQDSRRVWLRAQPFDLVWRHSIETDQVTVSPVALTVMGAAVSLRELDWLSDGSAGPGQIKASLQLEPLNLPAILKQWQPQAGWGGDLMLGGEIRLFHNAVQPWHVQAQVRKLSGDLTMSEPSIEGNSQQKLGVDTASVNLEAADGVWTLTQLFEGRVLGRLSGRQTVRVARAAELPSASDPLSGDIDLQIGSLRPWAAWVPAGWRLSGQLHGRAELSGTVGAPQYRGLIQGQDLRLAHALMGVNLSDGRLQLELQGDRATLTELTARSGQQGGVVRATGQASLGAAPEATLDVQADRFALLQRLDRRILISGQAHAVLGEEDIQLQGKVKVDEGLFDFTRSDAPTVGDDVNVINGPGQTQQEEGGSGSGAAGKRKLLADVDIDLGEKLHLRGRGLDTDLTGKLKFTSPNNRPSLQGTVKAVNGTYAAYGQKLDIERGAIVFSGAIENPRLDILAMRRQSPMAASSDVKVGVKIAGTAMDPRVSLYSDPAMSETDKLSWLILGRGPSGLGGADIGLLQSAAVALLSGEGPSTTDNLMSTLGIDELSLHQSDGTVRDTVVNVGKQLSKYWYLGYERNLNATSGNWQLIYRLAQRFTLRAQTGVDNAVDLIWAWRWD